MITEYKDICVVCGRPKEETHHLVFGRGMRKLADEDGLVIPLCNSCHDVLHECGVAGALSKIIGQLQWENEHDGSREDFRKRYGRSYL